MGFIFPDSIDILIAVLKDHGFSVDTQMERNTTPAMIPSSLELENLPFVMLVGLPGVESPRAPLASHEVQARVFATDETTTRDAAALAAAVLKGGPLDGGAAGMIDEVQATTPVMVDSGYGSRTQYNMVLSCAVRAL